MRPTRTCALFSILSLAACAAPTSDAAQPGTTGSETATVMPTFDVAALRQRLAPIASCATTDEVELWRRVWCQGAKLGTELLPEAPTSPTPVPFVGLSFGLPHEGDLAPAVEQNVPLLAVLLLSATSGRVVRVGPETEQEKRDIEGLMLAAAALLAGDRGDDATALVVPETLRAFVTELLAQPLQALTWGKPLASLAGPMQTYLFVVRASDRPEALITVELAKNGYFVSLFPFVPLEHE